MQKKILTSALMFLLFIPAKGQLKHVQGISNVGITYGISGNGNLFGASYSRYFRPSWIWNINVLYESGQVESTKLNNWMLNSGADRTLFQAGEFLYVNAGLSAFVGFEKLESESEKERRKFIFGPAGNVNVELYLNSRFLLQVKAEQYYSPLSELGKWFPVYSLSFKYCIF